MTTRSQPTAKSLTVKGLRLRYLEWGRADALPAVYADAPLLSKPYDFAAMRGIVAKLLERAR